VINTSLCINHVIKLQYDSFSIALAHLTMEFQVQACANTVNSTKQKEASKQTLTQWNRAKETQAYIFYVFDIDLISISPSISSHPIPSTLLAPNSQVSLVICSSAYLLSVVCFHISSALSSLFFLSFPLLFSLPCSNFLLALSSFIVIPFVVLLVAV